MTAQRTVEPGMHELVPLDEELDLDEVAYATAARAHNTLRGYRSDLARLVYVEQCHRPPNTAGDARRNLAVSHRACEERRDRGHHGPSNLVDPLRPPSAKPRRPDPGRPREDCVGRDPAYTWCPARPSGPADAAELFDVLDACPTVRRFKSRGRADEPDLAGARDRALLLVGFTAALRRSELASLRVEHLAEHPNGVVISIPRSKTNQHGLKSELVVLPRASSPTRCPVTAVQHWLALAGITTGPVLRRVTKGNRPGPNALNDETVNQLVQAAIRRADLDPSRYSAHSLRAGFVTYAHLRGATDRAIAHQSRHRSLAGLGQYVRVHKAWDDNAATHLGL